MNFSTRFFQAIGDDKRTPGIHVSHLTQDCVRKSFYDIKFPPSIDRSLLIKFWWGKMAHIQPILKHHELTVKWNDIEGTVDEYEDGLLVDKKTIVNLDNTRYLPQSQYVKQIEYYAVMLRENGYPVNAAKIFYISKADEKTLEKDV